MKIFSRIFHLFACALALFASHTLAASDTPQAALDSYFREAIAGDAHKAAHLLYVNSKRLKLQGLDGRAAPPWDLFRLLQLGPFPTKNGFYNAYADYLQGSRGAGFIIADITVTDIEALATSPVPWADAGEGEMIRATVHIRGQLREFDGRTHTETILRILALIRTTDGWRILQYL